MASNSSVNMDVDNPLVLKRSSSAPMINQLNNSMASDTSSSSIREPTANLFSNSGSTGSNPCRPRRFSTSFSPLATSNGSGQLSPKLTPRVNQLRLESVDLLCGREAAHERQLHSTMVMSQSWEDLTLVNNKNDEGNGKNNRTLDPLQLNLCGGGSGGGSHCSSPSPTRSGLPPKQCFSPSAFKNSLSPSPTRKFATRRSQSPIAMKPSALGPVKRKFELEDQLPPPKRGGLLCTKPLTCERMSSESDSTSSDFDCSSDQSMTSKTD